jgi:hypothetical protein
VTEKWASCLMFYSRSCLGGSTHITHMRQCLEKEELLQGDFTFIFTQAASTYSLNIGHHDETNTCLLALSKGVKKGKEHSFFCPRDGRGWYLSFTWGFPVSGHGQTWGQGLNEEKIQEHEIVHGAVCTVNSREESFPRSVAGLFCILYF